MIQSNQLEPFTAASRWQAWVGVVIAIATGWTAGAAESPSEFFELHVRPLLIEKCSKCHSGKPNAKSELFVLSREALLAGGEYGPAVVPGEAEASLLVEAVKRIHKELRMPPKNGQRLTAREVDALVKWIDDGAHWPEESTATSSAPIASAAESDPGGAIDAGDHWAFQPRRAIDPPSSVPADWSHSEIDRFLSAAHKRQQLQPVGLADRRTLIRRATFDLIGLPPATAEIEAFIDDPADDEIAFSKVVDRLLASPHYGERWGRHWLDAARYADTQGDVGDFPIPAAYLYRNWVIDALNGDMPYDEFIQRQIAGDILAADEGSPEAARDSIIATGFVALSCRFGNTKTEDMHLTIEDTIDTIGRGIMGLTMRCARCHDHKFDPLLNSDYYGIYGIFESTRYPWMGSSNAKSPSALSPVIPGKELVAEVEDYFDLITRYEYQLNNHFRPWLKPTIDGYGEVMRQIDEAKKTGHDLKELESEREDLLQFKGGKFRELMIHGLDWITKEKKSLGEGPKYELVFAVSEREPHDARIHLRGDPNHLGKAARRQTPHVFGGESLTRFGGSGRLEFAEWLTGDDHPLTARVIVNRVWRHHFGRGLVSTVDDFGRQGELPTHPELLDWLAESLVADGWSLKKLHRRIMLTRVYRLSSSEHETGNRDPASLSEADPDNIWLARFPRRRLEAEAIRDAILFTAGCLDTTPGEAHPFKPWYVKKYSLNAPFHEEFPTQRRSVYLMTQRLFKHSFLGLFDGPDTSQSTAGRSASNVPGQALYLMNSDFIREQAVVFADRALEQPEPHGNRVQWIWQRAYGRPASDDEVRLAVDHIKNHEATAENRTNLEQKSWASLARAVFTSNEFFYID